jgi:RNA-directed DNA polymerase
MSRSTPFNSISDSTAELFSLLKTRSDIADLLNVTDKNLRHLIYVLLPKGSLYRIFEIKKKSGGIRKIISPNPRLKEIQNRLLNVLSAIYSPKYSAHGFIKNRSICSNAKLHIRKDYVLNIDLEDFFPSINFGRVRGMFLAEPYKCTKEVATVLAQICCHNNELPQGSPISPIISNMICARLDSHLSRLARKYHCNYSRYADDITLSLKNHSFPHEIAKTVKSDGKIKYELGNSLLNTIKNNGFKVNPRKTRLQKSNEKQVVTGLITNKKLNVPREFIRNVRAMLYNWEKEGIRICQQKFERHYLIVNRHDSKPKLFKEMVRGKIDFIGTVRGKDDAIYLKLLQQLSKLDDSLLSKRTLSQLKIITDRHQHVLENLWVVEATALDDSECCQGTGFYVENYGVITCSHVLMNDESSKVDIYRRSGAEKQLAGIKKLNKELDLAILSLRENPESVFNISHTKVTIGDKIWLAGFPQFSPQHTGIVQSGEIIAERNHMGKPRILISAAVISGNSGGPVFDSDWNVIGVAVKGISGQNNPESGAFFEFIPISQLTELLKS